MKKAGKKSKSTPAHISYDPEDAEITGLANDVDVEVVEADAVFYDYGGKTDANGDPIEVPALHLALQLPDSDEPLHQYWGAGSKERIVPSDDGQHLVPASGSSARGLSTTCNAKIFMDSLKNAGFPMAKLNSEGFSCLVGLNFHLIRVPQPTRSGIKQEGDRGAGTVAVVDEINSMPGEKKGKGKGKGKAKAAAPAPAKKGKKKPVEDDDEDESDSDQSRAQEVVLALLEEHGKIPSSRLLKLVMEATKGDKERKAILNEVQDDDFLKSDLFAVDKKGVITAAEPAEDEDEDEDVEEDEEEEEEVDTDEDEDDEDEDDEDDDE